MSNDAQAHMASWATKKAVKITSPWKVVNIPCDTVIRAWAAKALEPPGFWNVLTPVFTAIFKPVLTYAAVNR